MKRIRVKSLRSIEGALCACGVICAAVGALLVIIGIGLCNDSVKLIGLVPFYAGVLVGCSAVVVPIVCTEEDER